MHNDQIATKCGAGPQLPEPTVVSAAALDDLAQMLKEQVLVVGTGTPLPEVVIVDVVVTPAPRQLALSVKLSKGQGQPSDDAVKQAVNALLTQQGKPALAASALKVAQWLDPAAH